MKKQPIELRILTPGDAENLDAESWRSLVNTAEHTNPFFERWNLLPALRHLSNNSLWLVTAWQDGELICLFPVEKKTRKRLITYLSIWQHPHCYLSTPLIKKGVDLRQVFCLLDTVFQPSWLLIPNHEPELFKPLSHRLRSQQFDRAAIDSTSDIESHIDNLPRKLKREVKRCKKKLENTAQLKHHEHTNIKQGLDAFILLEHQGWKGRTGGSIRSKLQVEKYYRDMIAMAESGKHFIFQELRADNEAIAINMRMLSGEYGFDVKTTYQEKLKHLAPGKLLEMLNLETFKSANLKHLDSCTSPDNAMINQLWPDRLKLERSQLFFNNWKSRLWHMIYKMYFHIRPPNKESI